MASKEYIQKLRESDPEKYKTIYGTGARKRYLKRMKEERPDDYINYRLRVKNTPSYRSNKRKHNRIGNLKKYGLTSITFDKILLSQGSKCACCNLDLTGVRQYIDHCHDKNIVRGILCLNCNVALGHVKDNVKVLKSMIKYLTK